MSSCSSSQLQKANDENYFRIQYLSLFLSQNLFWSHLFYLESAKGGSLDYVNLKNLFYQDFVFNSFQYIFLHIRPIIQQHALQYCNSLKFSVDGKKYQVFQYVGILSFSIMIMLLTQIIKTDPFKQKQSLRKFHHIKSSVHSFVSCQLNHFEEN